LIIWTAPPLLYPPVTVCVEVHPRIKKKFVSGFRRVHSIIYLSVFYFIKSVSIVFFTVCFYGSTPNNVIIRMIIRRYYLIYLLLHLIDNRRQQCIGIRCFSKCNKVNLRFYYCSFIRRLVLINPSYILTGYCWPSFNSTIIL